MQKRLVSRSWKIPAVALSANNRGSIVFEMAESPCREDLRRNSGSGRYLSIASSVCWIADGETRNRPEWGGLDRGLGTSRSPPKSRRAPRTGPRENPKAAEEEHRPKDHVGHQRPGDRARQLQRHQEPSLLHQREIGFGRGEPILLSRRLGIKRAKRARDWLPTVESDLDFELLESASAPCFLTKGLRRKPFHASGSPAAHNILML
jgi:hypothetical protein